MLVELRENVAPAVGLRRGRIIEGGHVLRERVRPTE
jgi:hypothetical protein